MQGRGWELGLKYQDPGDQREHAAEHEVVETPGPEDQSEQDRGDQRRDELGELKQPQVHWSELVCEQDGGQRDRGYRTRRRAHRDHYPAHRERAAKRAYAQQWSLGAILVHEQN